MHIPEPTFEVTYGVTDQIPTRLTPRFRAMIQGGHETLRARLARAVTGEVILVASDPESGESLSVSAWKDGPSVRLQIERSATFVAGIERMYPGAVLDMSSPRLAQMIVDDLDALLQALATRQTRVTPT